MSRACSLNTTDLIFWYLSKAEGVAEKERRWGLGSIPNLIQLSYPWDSFEVKEYERNEWLPCCEDCHSMWLTHVLICCSPHPHWSQPDQRLTSHITTLWAGPPSVRPSSSQTLILSERTLSVKGSPSEPIHTPVVEGWKLCVATDCRVIHMLALSKSTL